MVVVSIKKGLKPTTAAVPTVGRGKSRDEDVDNDSDAKDIKSKVSGSANGAEKGSDKDSNDETPESSNHTSSSQAYENRFFGGGSIKVTSGSTESR